MSAATWAGDPIDDSERVACGPKVTGVESRVTLRSHPRRRLIVPRQPGGGVEEVEIGRRLPEGLPVLPLKETVTFPDTLTPLAVGQERSIKLVNDVLGGERTLAMVASKNPDVETPGPDDLYRVGVAGTVARMLKVPDDLRVFFFSEITQVALRFKITEWIECHGLASRR